MFICSIHSDFFFFFFKENIYFNLKSGNLGKAAGKQTLGSKRKVELKFRFCEKGYSDVPLS